MKAFTIGIAFAGGPGRHAIARIILPGGSLEELHDDATEFEFHQTGSAVERAAHSNEISAGPGGVSAALYWSVCSRKKMTNEAVSPQGF
jgi:hypothetical protein